MEGWGGMGVEGWGGDVGGVGGLEEWRGGSVRYCRKVVLKRPCFGQNNKFRVWD